DAARNTVTRIKSSFMLSDISKNTQIILENSTLTENKSIYTYLNEKQYVKPITENLWKSKFQLADSPNYWKKNYQAMFNLPTNDIKQFRFKLINAILPCKENLFKWRIADEPLCEVCKIQENYEHMFITCPVVAELWQQLNNSFKKCNFTQPMNELQHLILGYKPDQQKYKEMNYILSLISYSIFKAYCVSENRKKYIDTVFLVKNEFTKSLEIWKTLKLDQTTLFKTFVDFFVHGK
ncbi:MAG: zinc-binding domain-containing protein, partial [gamma proteobacterium symbiont of Lucinoma myriamae]|nr:zinc-binding domain-containing protein [gamma proteobacterium symbiont of Lucinoma myriamae]